MLVTQSSVLSNEQALLGGHSMASWRRVRAAGGWQRLAPGIYVLGVEKPTFAQLLWAGHLLAGPDSAIGGAAALVRWGISKAEPEVIDLWLPEGVRRVPRGPWQYRQDWAHRLDHTRELLPLIRPEDAILDEAHGHPLDTFVGLVTDALRPGRVSIKSLSRVIQRRPRLAERRLWLAALGDLAGIESSLEHVYRRGVERAHGLPSGRRQVSITEGSRSDVWYDAYATLVELDGKAGHLDGAFRDLDRDNAHALLAQTTLRYGSADVRGRPCAVARQVGQVLRLRGWTGELRRCPACPVQWVD